VWQATFRVVESEDVEPLLDLEELFAPKYIQARLYVLRGVGLQPKRNKGAGSPYLVVKLGEHTIDDKMHRVSDRLSPEWFRSFELGTTLPGESVLKVCSLVVSGVCVCVCLCVSLCVWLLPPWTL